MWVKNTSHSLKKDALVLLIFSGQYAFVKACISKRCFSFTCIRCFSVLCIKISANIHNMKGKSPRSMPAKFYSQVRHSPYIISGAGVSFEREKSIALSSKNYSTQHTTGEKVIKNAND